MTQTNDQISTHISETSALERAKRLAARVVSSMQAQGYQDIEYILTDCQLTVVASASGKMPRTQYLTLPHGPRR